MVVTAKFRRIKWILIDPRRATTKKHKLCKLSHFVRVTNLNEVRTKARSTISRTYTKLLRLCPSKTSRVRRTNINSSYSRFKRDNITYEATSSSLCFGSFPVRGSDLRFTTTTTTIRCCVCAMCQIVLFFHVKDQVEKEVFVAACLIQFIPTEMNMRLKNSSFRFDTRRQRCRRRQLTPFVYVVGLKPGLWMDAIRVASAILDIYHTLFLHISRLSLSLSVHILYNRDA